MNFLLRKNPFLRPINQSHLTNHPFQTPSEKYFIKSCIENITKNRSLLLGKALHAHLIIHGLTHFALKLISMYVHCGAIRIARQVFDEMPKSNYDRWIVIVGAHAKCGFYKQALSLVKDMIGEGVRVNNYVIPSALKACGHLADCLIGREIHGLSLRSGFECDGYVSSALIDMYSRCGFVGVARKVFDRIVDKDLVGLNAMITGYVMEGSVKEALGLVENARLIGVNPNVVTWNILISGFSHDRDDIMVDEIFEQMRIHGIEPDVVSWTCVISGLVKNFRNKEAFVTFKKMLDHGCCPTANTLSTLLSACANVADLECGKEIHGLAFIIGLEKDVYVRSALIDMYAKCGCIFQASTLFQKMTIRNTPTWNSMIFGYANHGYCNEALELFNTMEVEDGEKLDHLTFTAVLTACSHGGILEHGRRLFRSMQEKYRITPRLEHYACMVDLVGRAGKLTEAYDIISAMPIEPDLFVWGALLGACKQHGNIELAEVAAKHLSKLEPRGAGTSLLSNLYAGAGSWGNAMRMKKLIKKKKLKSIAGSSWVEAG